MQGEFRMITDLTAVAPKEILFNYDELKAFLSENLEQYRTMVVTEEDISDARANRAKLNKLADNINSYRINVKNQLMAQYDSDFKPKCDELVSMTKEATENISSQIKAFEQAEKDAKIAELRAFYDAAESDEAKDYCPWESICNPKWGNKGFVISQAQSEIRDALEKTERDLESIRTMGGEDVPYLLDCYRQTRDIGVVIRKSAELKTAREREAQRKREAEERQRERDAARAAAEAEKEATRAEPKRETEYAPAVTTELEQDDLVTVDFRVVCTKTQLAMLGRYMRENGIKYGKTE